MQLQAIIGHFAAHIGHQLFGHGAKMSRIWRAIVQLPSGLTQKYAARLQFNLHVGKTKLQGLKLIDRFSKGFALGHIGPRCVKGLLRRPQRTGRDIQPPAVQPSHGVGKPEAFGAQKVFDGCLAVIQLHLPGRLRAPAHFVFQPAKGQPLCAIFHDQSRDALWAVIACPGHDNIGIRIASTRDKGLGASQGEICVALKSSCLQCRRIRS